MPRFWHRRPPPALVVSLIALFVAPGGTGYAVTALPRNSVGSPQVINGSLQTVDLSSRAPRSLKGNRGAPGTVGAIGATGARGAAGTAGTPGSQGPPGAVGATGAIGATGAQGTPGLPGATGRERHRRQARRSRRDRSDRPPGRPGSNGSERAQGDPGPAALFAAVNADGTIGSERGVVAGPGTGKQGTGIYAVVFDRNISQCVPLVTMGIPFGANTAAGGTAEAIFDASTQIGIVTRDLTGALSNESFFLAVVC